MLVLEFISRALSHIFRAKSIQPPPKNGLYAYGTICYKKACWGEWALSMVGVEKGREFRFRGDLYSQESIFPLVYYASSDLFVCLHWKNPRFTAFLDSNLHTRLAIVTANELGLAFPTRNLPKKFRQDPSTFYLVIVVTDKQTDRQTYAGDSIIPRESFRGDNEDSVDSVRDNYGCVRTTSCEREPTVMRHCDVVVATGLLHDREKQAINVQRTSLLTTGITR